MPDADEVRVDGLDYLSLGHSNETLEFTLHWREQGAPHSQQVVLRTRPAGPGLLEPYDLATQYHVLRSLDGSPVPVPKALWLEPDGDVLGRPFFTMEKVDGTVYERFIPDALANSPERLRRMSSQLVETIAAIHRVDWRSPELSMLGDGNGFLIRELDRWESEIHRVQRGPLPSLELLASLLRAQMPEQCPQITLVHGDCKAGNFAFRDDEVVAVFDWELTTVGDPLTDIGWALVNWGFPGSLTSRPGSLTADEFVELYERLTGIAVRHRAWYEALAGFKMAVILLVGCMLFDAGATDDLRFAHFGLTVGGLVASALARLGVDEPIDVGPVTARDERVLAAIKGLLEHTLVPEIGSDGPRVQAVIAALLLGAMRR
jgi:aminoglycoside phosphotransferase (APT) family kinase protein